MKQISYSNPAAGTYHLAPGIRITGDYAVCDYPLRAIRLNATTKQLLLLCTQERICQELAAQIDQPVKRVEALCRQLHWKGLLEVGPYLPPETWPDVSIIIPTHNRSGQLERCIRSLLAMEYPASCLEIIVVDDGSTDGTGVLLEQLEQEFTARGGRLRIVRHTERQGVARSRNSGAESALSELLAYIDSDCVASPAWLAELVPAFSDASVAAVGGMIRAYERKSMLGRYEDVRSSLFMGVRPQQVHLEGPLTYLPTANLVVRRDIWKRIGGFEPFTFGEDVDFCRRLLATGSHILYLPRAVVYHDYRTRLGAFLHIHASYASSEATLLQHHPQERRILVLPPEQATFAGLVLGGLWAILGRPTSRGGSGVVQGTRKGHPYHTRHDVSCMVGVPLAGTLLAFLALILAILLTLLGTRNRIKKVREHQLPISPLAILRATLRGHLAYTYHLCRHLTRYYTLPLFISGILLPPLLILATILCSIVIGVDYMRLRPDMSPGRYALCSLLDDCAYEVGVLIGCIKQKTWKPLVPVIKRKNPTGRS
ncbi:MAG TPA: mycofactocin biosynthesis glycosyltransferase MftF [Ktedonobacteraceae bacterium]